MRKNFPTLHLNKNSIYLDNAATSLKLAAVIRTVNFFTRKFPLNLHSSMATADYLLLEQTVQNTREITAKWINARRNEISFLPSTTYALNLLALTFTNLLQPTCSITITKVEHSSNTYPWVDLANKRQLRLNYLHLDKQFAIDKERITESVDSSTMVVSFAHLSNSLGSLNDIKGIAKAVKAISPSCYVIVDACQSITQSLVDVKDWEIDALVFSAHKFYGPDGVAILWTSKRLTEQTPHLLWGGGKKASPLVSNNAVSGTSKFEVGTISVPYIAGLGEVFRFMGKINWRDLTTQQQRLRNYTISSLLRVRGVKIYNRNATGNILLFNIEGFHPQDLAAYLARNKVFVRAGDFCSPFLHGLIGKRSAIRLSLAIYNNKREINTLVNYLQQLTINSCIE